MSVSTQYMQSSCSVGLAAGTGAGTAAADLMRVQTMPMSCWCIAM